MGHGPAEGVASFDNMLTSDQKGAVAETAIVHAAVKLGISVYTPVAEGGRYDMIFELAERLRVRDQLLQASQPRVGSVLLDLLEVELLRLAEGGEQAAGYRHQ